MNLQGKLHVEFFCESMKVEVTVDLQGGGRDELQSAFDAVYAVAKRLDKSPSSPGPLLNTGHAWLAND